MLCEGNFAPEENPKVGTSRLGATFVSRTVRFLKNCHPNEMLSRATFVSGTLRFVKKNVIRKGYLAPNENPKVGTSWVVAALVSRILRFLKNVLRMKFGP